VGGVGIPTIRPDDHHDPNREKIKEGIEGEMDDCRNIEWALYLVQIALLMLPRGIWRKGVD
jgi:hypothetical protein